MFKRVLNRLDYTFLFRKWFLQNASCFSTPVSYLGVSVDLSTSEAPNGLLLSKETPKMTYLAYVILTMALTFIVGSPFAENK